MNMLLDQLTQKLGEHLRLGVGAAQSRDACDLWPAEEKAMARATPARRAEFAAGRTAARQAMRAIGALPSEIPMAADRSPIWPRGIIGSISHHDGQCVAIAARRRAAGGLGVDLDSTVDLPGDLWSEILTTSECNWLSEQPEKTRGGLAKQIFSAKEAAYKALYPLSGRVVGFDAMTILPDPTHARFTAILQTSFGSVPAGTRLQGHMFTAQGHVLTALALPADVKCGQNAAAIPNLEMECFPTIPA